MICLFSLNCVIFGMNLHCLGTVFGLKKSKNREGGRNKGRAGFQHEEEDSALENLSQSCEERGSRHLLLILLQKYLRLSTDVAVYGVLRLGFLPSLLPPGHLLHVL